MLKNISLIYERKYVFPKCLKIRQNTNWKALYLNKYNYRQIFGHFFYFLTVLSIATLNIHTYLTEYLFAHKKFKFLKVDKTF